MPGVKAARQGRLASMLTFGRQARGSKCPEPDEAAGRAQNGKRQPSPAKIWPSLPAQVRQVLRNTG